MVKIRMTAKDQLTRKTGRPLWRFSKAITHIHCLCSVVIKVGMVGDSQIGKTSLMVKYVEGSFDEDYIQTLGLSFLVCEALILSMRILFRLGVNFMEKTISVRRTTITFSIWDLGGQREFVNMLPLVCNDAVAILFMFDLSRKSTLNSVKEWYRQARGFNKVCYIIIVGYEISSIATSGVIHC
jgi:GTP-binding protein of the ras superfamily involved in termination of M-phase